MKEFKKNDLLSAKRRIDPYIRKNNLLKSKLLSDYFKKNIYLKLENLQITGAFKYRGALNMLLKLLDGNFNRKVVAYSSGNHAIAVATASNKLHINSTLYIPNDIPDIKKKKITDENGNILHYDRVKDDREKLVSNFAYSQNLTVIPSSNDMSIIEGTGTIAVEILDIVDNIDLIIAPVGGGGLTAGVALASHNINSKIDIIGVEPLKGDDTRRSIYKGEIVTIPVPETIADGLRHTKPSDLPYHILKEHISDIITVTDSEISYAISYAYHKLNQIIEPSAAVPLAALLFNRIPSRYENICVILSGGNISFSLRQKLLFSQNVK